MNVKGLTAWVKEREQIRIKKESLAPRPWTDDPIFRQYRFCNAFREDDKVTRWIYTNWVKPNADDPDLWFAMAVARNINLPEALKVLGYPEPWDADHFLDVMEHRRAEGATVYNNAYMIRASAQKGLSKAQYLATEVLTPLWEKREHIRPAPRTTLEGFHARLEACFGLGSFMAAQIIADAKRVGSLQHAPDRLEFAASGPGSRRGLNRVLGREVNTTWKEPDWRVALSELRGKLVSEFKKVGVPWCDAQNTQNQLCEFDKYERVRLGEGRPKQKYAPAPSTLFS